MKHIILAAALIAFSAPAFATGDPPPPPPSRHTIGGTFATSGSAAFIGGSGRSTSQMETGNVSMGHAQVTRGAQRSLTTSDSYGIGKSTGHGAFTGFGSGLSGAFTFGPLGGGGHRF